MNKIEIIQDKIKNKNKIILDMYKHILEEIENFKINFNKDSNLISIDEINQFYHFEERIKSLRDIAKRETYMRNELCDFLVDLIQDKDIKEDIYNNVDKSKYMVDNNLSLYKE